MSFTSSLLTIFEIVMAAFVIWAVFNEKRFIEFEDRVVTRFRRRRFKVLQGGSKVSKSYYPEKHRA